MGSGTKWAIAGLAVAGVVSGTLWLSASPQEKERPAQKAAPTPDPKKLYLVVETGQPPGTEGSAKADAAEVRRPTVEQVWVLSGDTLNQKKIERPYVVLELSPFSSCPKPQECNPCGKWGECPWPPPPIHELSFQARPVARAQSESPR